MSDSPWLMVIWLHIWNGNYRFEDYWLELFLWVFLSGASWILSGAPKTGFRNRSAGTLEPWHLGQTSCPLFSQKKWWDETRSDNELVWVESLYTQRRPVLQLNCPFWPSRIFVGEFRFVWLADLKHRISLLLVIPSGQKAWQWKSIQFQVANHSHVHFCSPKCYATNYVYFPTSLLLALKSTKKLTFFSLTLDLFGELLPPFLHVFAISFSLFEPIFFLIQYL